VLQDQQSSATACSQVPEKCQYCPKTDMSQVLPRHCPVEVLAQSIARKGCSKVEALHFHTSQRPPHRPRLLGPHPQSRPQIVPQGSACELQHVGSCLCCSNGRWLLNVSYGCDDCKVRTDPCLSIAPPPLGHLSDMLLVTDEFTGSEFAGVELAECFRQRVCFVIWLIEMLFLNCSCSLEGLASFLACVTY
jgi:hypothetical protein